jgi:hypothetical protein
MSEEKIDAIEASLSRISNSQDLHGERITKLEYKLGVVGDRDSEPDFITRKEFSNWSQKVLIPRLQGIEEGQNKIMIYITAAGIAGAIIMWLLNSGVFKIN